MTSVASGQSKLVCSGRVTDAEGLGQADLRVELWDAEQVCTDLVALTYTDSTGRFGFSLDPDYLDGLFLGREKALTFRIFTASAQVVSTFQTWRAAPTPASFRFVVDPAVTSPRLGHGSCRVRGRVTDGRAPSAGLTVRIYDKQLRSEDEIDVDEDVTTDSNGEYVVDYLWGAGSGEALRCPDVVVKVFDSTGATLLATSEVVCRAPATLTVDMLVGADTYVGPSEYDRLSALLTPMLGTLGFTDLTEEESSYLACRAAEDDRAVKALSQAHVLALAMDVDPSITYALVRRQLPADHRALLRHPPASLRRELVAASAANVIAPLDEAAIDAAIDDLRAAAVALAFATPDPGTTCNLGDVLEVALPTLGDRQQLVDEYIAFEGSIEDFWTHLGTLTAFSDPEVLGRAQLSLQWGALTRFHLPLIKKLEAMRVAETHTTLKDLATLSESDWADLLEEEIESSPIGAPADVPGTDEAARRATYAKVLTRTMETAFPTTAIMARIQVESSTDDRYTFLANNPSFEFGKTRASLTLPDAVYDGIDESDREAVKQNILAMERMFKITPRYEDMKRLMDGGLKSSKAVQRMGKGPFMAKYGPLLDDGVAQKVFRKASFVTAATTFLQSKYAAAFHSVSMRVLPDMTTSGALDPAIADWQTLFGKLDMCACEHCQSVLSPAAYLVDILEFLRGIASTHTRPDGSKLTAAELLLGDGEYQGRRPDIARIALSCENTNTALPYVDLVNEILERRISGVSLPTTIQTTGTTAELLALPELVDADAYDTLADEVFPWNLPFDFFGEEARVYLDHLGVPRSRLMELFQQPTGPVPSDAEVSREKLRLSAKDRELLTGTWSGDPEDAWGLSGAGWDTDLLRVTAFLEATGLEYEALQTLLETNFLTGLASGTPAITVDGGMDPCLLVNLSITGLGTPLGPIWDATHRFLRLRLRLGWSLVEMDQVMTAFGGTFDDALLGKIADLREVMELLHLPLTTALALWAPIDTYALPVTKVVPLYEQLFLNKAVFNPPDAAFGDATALSGTLEEHRDTIMAALRLSAADFGLLTDPAVTSATLTLPGPLASTALNLANLSRIYRIVTLARALKMPVKDVLVLRALSGLNPLLGDTGEAATPADTLVFVELVKKLQKAKVSATELHYLLRHVGRTAADNVLRDQRVAAVDAALVKVTETTPNVVDPTGAELQQLLERMLRTTTPDSTTIVADARAMVEICLTTTALDEAGQDALIDATFDAALFDTTAIKANLVGGGSPTLTVVSERVAYLQGLVVDFIRHRDQVAAVKQVLTDTFKLPAETVAAMVETVGEVTSWLSASTSGATAALDDFLLPPAEPAATEKQQAMDRFTKAARIIQLTTSKSAKHAEIAALFGVGRNSEWLDLNAPPLDPPADETDFGLTLLLPQLARLLDVGALASRIKAGRVAFYELLSLEASGPDWLDALALRTDWNRADLDTLTTAFGLTWPDDANDEVGLTRLADACEALGRLGVSAATALEWADTESATEGYAEAVAIEVKQAAKAKHTPEAWLEVARPLRDELREKQRSTLLAYVIRSATAPSLPTANAVYGELLIDVEMSPCQLTSRIKQAISSVQLFVQRALLNLEPELQLDPSEAAQWKWMKHYRVWEAARKIFLFPENWIEPELRDDKTPFFKALESELRQGEITDASAEVAYEHYLEKLSEVARLDVCGMYREQEAETDTSEARDVLHVFGRTLAHPHQYFYRTRVNDARWTPWEKVDIDIPGEVILPIVHNRTLRLYWPEIEETDYVHSRIVSSERRQGGWTAPHIASYRQSNEHRALDDGSWLSMAFDPSPSPLTGEPALLMMHLTTENYVGQIFEYYGPVRRYRLNSCAPGLSVESDDLHSVIVARPFETHPAYADDVELDDRAEHSLQVKMWLGDDLQLVPTLATAIAPFKVHAPRVRKVVETTGGGFEIWDEQPQFFLTNPLQTYFVHIEEAPYYAWTAAAVAAPKPLQALDLGLGVGSEVTVWAKAPTNTILIPIPHSTRVLQFDTFYHPHVCAFRKALAGLGVQGLRDWNAAEPPLQLLGAEDVDTFDTTYDPAPIVKQPYPIADVDFSLGGAYSIYNWELFFHTPLHIAVRLMKNQRFEEAQKWFHAIFDPTDHSDSTEPARYWKLRPFRDNKALSSLQDAFSDLAADESVALLQAMFADNDDGVKTLVEQIDAWRREPFNPHLVARMRLVAYQKTVVMRYLENLIAWGDMLFRRDTLEAINEATQLYVLAADILGPKPTILPAQEVTIQTYAQMSGDIDAFGNLLEPLAPVRANTQSKAASIAGALLPHAQPHPQMGTLYFCIPRNDQLLGFWDTVADRLFKIRHCMNIEGVVRQLPLFEPPIDPALLVQAAAAGVDLESVLNDLYTPQPYYRFGVLHGKAMEFAGAVVGLGQSLLAAIEKRDSEELAMLRSTQEVEILRSIKDTRKLQIKEAKESLKALEESKRVVQERHDFYSTRSRTSDAEDLGIDLLKTGTVLQGVGAGIATLGAILYFTSDTEIGTAGTTTSNGGTHIGSAVTSAGSALASIGGTFQSAGNIALTNASFDRRHDDWKLQARLAQKELVQIDKQIAAANIRIAIAEKELETHEKQIENAAAVEAYLRDKYTNQDLYDWMVDTLSATYFQAYQLAFDMARRAERCYQFERCEPASKRFVSFGYWDSLRKGLLSGEKLQHDLRRLEAAYLAENKREYEITKHISLTDLDPEALLTLRATGVVEVTIPRALFELDYPSHYMRRIKTLSVTIPSVGGNYASVNATVTLLKNTIYSQPSLSAGILEDYVPIQSVCTSGAMNDSGLFELNFRDERYLPFEGAGAEATLRLEMPLDTNAFDVATVGDVVLHMRYTSRDGGATFRELVRGTDTFTSARSATRLFSVRQELPNEWRKFFDTLTEEEGSQVLELAIAPENLPFVFGTGAYNITNMTLVFDWAVETDVESIYATLTVPSGPTLPVTPTPPPTPPPAPPNIVTSMGAALYEVALDPAEQIAADTDPFVLTFAQADLGGTALEDLTEDYPEATEHRRFREDAVRDIYVICTVTRS